jgi:hypothetical protein
VKARRRIADGKGCSEDDTLDIPSSVTIVVPVWEFMPLFEQSKLADQRKARERKSD